MAENTRSAVSLGNKGRSDLSVGMRVFHEKFGYGAIAEIEGNKLEIDFEAAGRKRVMDSFVRWGEGWSNSLLTSSEQSQARLPCYDQRQHCDTQITLAGY